MEKIDQDGKALAGAEFKLYEADEFDANGNIISGTPIKTADGKDYVVTTSDGRDGSQTKPVKSPSQGKSGSRPGYRCAGRSRK